MSGWTLTATASADALPLRVVTIPLDLAISTAPPRPLLLPQGQRRVGDGKGGCQTAVADAHPIAEFERAMQASLSGGVLKNLIVP